MIDMTLNYIRKKWQDHIVDQNGTIIQQGTPVSAGNLNNIEVGLANAKEEINNNAGVVRESIPSGFTTLSDLNYTFMGTNPNQIKLVSDSVAFVNGFKITIPAGTIIQLDAPPVYDPITKTGTASRDDLVFLEVWKTPVTDTDGEKINYRLRVVDGVDFTSHEEGVDSAFIQGQLTNPSTSTFSKSSTYVGLYSGSVVGASSDNTVYAIPMFKVRRRNNNGYDISLNVNGGISRVDGSTISDRPDGLFSNIISIYDPQRIKEQTYIGTQKDILSPFIQVQLKQNKDFKDGMESVKDEVGSVTLTNSEAYPFNNSKVSVALTNQKNNINYFIDVEPQSSLNIGDIIISEKQINGFKIEYTGSALSVIVKYFVRGGMFV